MTCDDLMTRDVVIVGPRDAAATAAGMMRDRGVGFLPVCDGGDRRPLGVVTDRDLVVRGLARAAGPCVTVGDLQSRPVVLCGRFEDLDAAVSRMAARRVSRLVVVDEEERVAGVLSLSDVARRASFVTAGAALRDITARERNRDGTQRAVRCAEVMRSDVVSVEPQATAQDAAAAMRVREVGFLPVCARGGPALGVVTDRDLTLRVMAAGRHASTPVQEVMTTDLVACSAADPVAMAEALMATQRKSRVLVLDAERRPVGVISLSRIARRDVPAAAGRTLHRIVAREA